MSPLQSQTAEMGKVVGVNVTVAKAGDWVGSGETIVGTTIGG